MMGLADNEGKTGGYAITGFGWCWVGRCFEIGLAAALMTASVGTESRASQNDLFVAQVVAGKSGDYTFHTEFHVVNLGDVAVEGMLVVTRDDGAPMKVFLEAAGTVGGGLSYRHREPLGIAPGGSDVRETQIRATGHPLEVGWARISVSGPIGVVVTLRAEDTRRGMSGVVTATSLLPDPPTRGFVVAASIEPPPWPRTGIALLNPSAEEGVSVLLRLRDWRGVDIVERVIELGPQEKLVQFLDEDRLFPDFWEIPRKAALGTLTGEATGPVVVTAIRVDDTYWSTFRVFNWAGDPAQ
jgi:hypothetical protein